MNRLLFTLTILTFSILFSQQHYKVIINDSSRLLINGQANITDYTCELEEKLSSKQLMVTANFKPRSITLDSAKLRIMVSNFDCGIAKMNSDFQESMKAEEFPYMTLQLNQIYLNDDPQDKRDTFDANVLITIANVSNYYDIEFSHRQRADGYTVIRGKHQMLMTDFKIVPPTALFGLIRVYGNIEIEFELILKVVATKKPSN
ncbi:MAG: hypothetical protein KDD94_07685 [Calditrichaeota bacterium]|nr:hypothetical protein [Calditrichota bacterium]